MTFTEDITPKYFDEYFRIVMEYHYANQAVDDTLEAVIKFTIYSETTELGQKVVKIENLGQVGEDLKTAIRNYVTINATEAELVPLYEKIIE